MIYAMTTNALVRVENPHSGLAPLADGSASLVALWMGGKDTATVRAYGRDLAAFAAFNGFDTVPAALDAFFALDAGSAHAAALQWRDASRSAPLAVATVNRRLAALRSVVQLARQVGRVAWVLDVPDLAAVKYRDTRGPGASGYAALVAAAAGRMDAKGARDRAVLRLLFDCALRRAEVVSLDVGHYDRDAGALWVLGKKRHERERMTLPAPTRAALDAWLLHRTTTDADAPLFVALDRATSGVRLTGRSVARVVGGLGTAAGLGTVRPHGLRHAAITHALDSTNGDVRRVAAFSRHKKLETLTVYDDARRDHAGDVAAIVAGVA